MKKKNKQEKKKKIDIKFSTRDGDVSRTDQLLVKKQTSCRLSPGKHSRHEGEKAENDAGHMGVAVVTKDDHFL